ncbi:MAG: pilus assembly protein PilM [Candidatus Omnitrophica bacterium]|nr:pilus assembly protein PilM [Candidatus Omnitrophota bacterium]
MFKLWRNAQRINIGIDLSSNVLKIACVETHPNKKQVTVLFTKDTSGLTDIEISKIIAGHCANLRIRNTSVFDIIPAHLAITKNIEIPSTNPQEIREIINLQAGRHTPYARDEIIVDYVNIGTYRHSYTKVLLVIVTRAAIKRHHDILDKSGLKLDRVLFAPECMPVFLSKTLKLENMNLPFATIHIDADFSDFAVISGDRLLFVRSIPIGCGHISLEPERYQMKLVEEIRRSQEAYQSEEIDKPPTALILTGATEELRGIESILSQNIALSVKPISYLTNLTLSPLASKTISETKRVSFLNLISALLVPDEVKVNLIPEEIRLKKVIEARGRDLIKTGIFILTILVLFFSILGMKIYFRGLYLKSITYRFQSIQEDAKRLEEELAKNIWVRNFLSKRGYSLEVLAQLHNLLPLEIELNDIRFDSQGKFNVRGTSESMSAVFSFIDSMEKSKYFKDVKTKYTTKRKEGTKDLTDFEISCILEEFRS